MFTSTKAEEDGGYCLAEMLSAWRVKLSPLKAHPYGWENVTAGGCEIRPRTRAVSSHFPSCRQAYRLEPELRLSMWKQRDSCSVGFGLRNQEKERRPFVSHCPNINN